MLYETHKVDITFQKTFQALAFDVIGSGVNILREISQRIGPRYFIRTEDLSIHGGTNLSEVRVRAALFSGAGEIQVTPERLFLKFTNVRADRSSEDLKIIKDVALLAEEVVKSTIPNLHFREDVIQFTAYIKLKEKNETAAALLNGLAKGSNASSRLKAPELGGSNIHFGLKTELENVKDKWNITYEMTRSVLGEDVIFLSGVATFLEGGAWSSIEEKFSHTEKTTDAFLSSVGLEST